MNAPRAPFLVTSIGYFALGLATAGFGLLTIAHGLAAAHTEQVSLVQVVPLLTLAIISGLFAAFYVAVGFAILKRRWRLFAIIGASISCFMVPFGTALGLAFLLWTRREWPASPVGLQ